MTPDDPDSGAPTRSELAQRLARVEEGVEHLDEKQDHVLETLDRVDDRLADDLEDLEETQDKLAERQRPLWMAYSATKYIVGPAGAVTIAVHLFV